MTLGCGRLFLWVHGASCFSVGRYVSRERLLRRLVYALDVYPGLWLMLNPLLHLVPILRTLASSGPLGRRSRCPLHMGAHADPLNRGSVERDAVHYDTGAGKRPEPGAQVAKYRSVYASSVQSDCARSTGGGRCED